MVSISKHDKKIWDKYISNFEKTVLLPKNYRLTGQEKYEEKKVVNKNDYKYVKKRRSKPEATLDLHGYTLYSAKLILHKYITNCYEKNIRSVLIITGKGIRNKGVIKEEVPKWLSEKNLKDILINYDIAPKHFGGEGALLLKIKNKYKNHN